MKNRVILEDEKVKTSARRRLFAVRESEPVENLRSTLRYAEGEARRFTWYDVLRTSLGHMRDDRITVAAGAFAYRWFLSIFPTIIALLGVASLIAIPQSFTVRLIHGVDRALPSGAAQVLTKAIHQATLHTNQNFLATVLATLFALWSAVSGMVVVQQGLDLAFEVAHDRTFFAKRRVGLALLVGGIVLGGAASALVVFGSSIGESIRHGAPLSGVAFEAVWNILRWVVALVLVNALFTMLYYFAPNRDSPTWRLTSVGAIVATALWALVSLAFSLYTSSFSSYNKTYGAFAGVAILVFWLYLTGLAIFVGGEIDAALERVEVLEGRARASTT